MKTSIIIVCWNRLEYTQGCVEHLRAFTTMPYEVIFVDNGSTDGTFEYLRDLCAANPSYTLIRNETNIGAGPATNQAIALSKGEKLVFLNNDALVTPEWLEGLHECMDSRDDIGIVGPMSNNISGVQQVQSEDGYSSPVEMLAYAQRFRKSFRKRYFAMWRLPLVCGLVKREVIDKIGVFDEQFAPGNFEDDDFCLRAVNAGFRNYVAGDVFIHHFGSDAWGDDFQGLINRNMQKFKDKNLKTTISACLIVKNEEKNIEKCLDRAWGMFDELIVVDTGSTDGTRDILKKYHAAFGESIKIYDFKWCNDFSAARNFALDQCTKDWIFILDADEILPELDRSKLYPLTAYRYETRNYTDNILWTGNRNCTGEYGADEKGQFWFPSTKIRLFPNDRRIRFQYPVHEVVEESVYQLGLFVDTSPVPVHHYGKYNEDQDLEKGKQYLELLQQIVEDSPADIRNMEQLALTYQARKEWDKAIQIWDRILALKLDNKVAWHNIGHAMVQKEDDFKSAIKCFAMAATLAPDDKDANYNLAYAFYKLGCPKAALERINMALKVDPGFLLGENLKRQIKAKI